MRGLLQKLAGNEGSRDFEISCLIAARVCLLALALLTASLCTVYCHDTAGAVVYFKPLALLFAFCALSALWIWWRRTGLVFTYLQFSADILIISGLIYSTGGPISPFLFLYLALVMAAAIITNRAIALAVALLSLGAYVILAQGLIAGWIPPVSADALMGAPQSGIFLQVVGLASAMVLIAVAVDFLRQKIWASHEQAEASKKSLQLLDAKQQVLIEGIPEGVIVTDTNEIIRSINSSAMDLLDLGEEQVLGRHLPTCFKALFPMAQFNSAELVEDDQNEVELRRQEGRDSLRLLFSKRAFHGPDGEPAGWLFLFENVTKLRSIERRLDLQNRMARLLAEKEESVAHPKLSEFIGESLVMQKIFKIIERVAPSDASVLISGESGTGKELVARCIHLSGSRAGGAFVAINCGAVPESLIESQLFGHKKGSFTGAHADQAGVFQQADGGTLFLDEVGEIPLHLQAKMLRAIQEKNIRPIGGERDLPVDVRIVSATNRNLKDEVRAGRFREDLFFRLNVIGISLPPLRDRREDIPLLVHSILKRLVQDGRQVVIPPETMELLMHYSYRGNVRELENILERAVVLGGSVILPEHLPEHVIKPVPELDLASGAGTRIIVDEDLELPANLDEILARVERRYLEAALSKTNGAKKKAAELLGINFRSFRYRLQKFGIGD